MRLTVARKVVGLLGLTTGLCALATAQQSPMLAGRWQGCFERTRPVPRRPDATATSCGQLIAIGPQQGLLKAAHTVSLAPLTGDTVQGDLSLGSMAAESDGTVHLQLTPYVVPLEERGLFNPSPDSIPTSLRVRVWTGDGSIIGEGRLSGDRITGVWGQTCRAACEDSLGTFNLRRLR